MPTYSAPETLSLIERGKPKTGWGRWHLVRSTNVLEFREDPGRGALYEIDLDDMQNSGACLDWIFQVAFKSWMAAKDRSDLLEAIRDVVDSQATLGSFGIGSGGRAKSEGPGDR